MDAFGISLCSDPNANHYEEPSVMAGLVDDGAVVNASSWLECVVGMLAVPTLPVIGTYELSRSWQWIPFATAPPLGEQKGVYMPHSVACRTQC